MLKEQIFQNNDHKYCSQKDAQEDFSWYTFSSFWED